MALRAPCKGGATGSRAAPSRRRTRTVRPPMRLCRQMRFARPMRYGGATCPNPPGPAAGPPAVRRSGQVARLVGVAITRRRCSLTRSGPTLCFRAMIRHRGDLNGAAGAHMRAPCQQLACTARAIWAPASRYSSGRHPDPLVRRGPGLPRALDAHRLAPTPLPSAVNRDQWRFCCVGAQALRPRSTLC